VKLVPVPIEEAFPADEGRRLAVVGAGGKSTTIGRIADVQAYREPPVVITTTTKIQRGQVAGPLESELTDELLREPPTLYTLAEPVDSGTQKLSGPGEDNVTKLLEEFPGRVLIEADGARGTKLKIHREYEPVVPEKVDAVLSIFDLSVLDQPANEDTVHALEAWGSLFPGEKTVRPEHIVTMFNEDHGYQVSEDKQHWLAMTHPGGLRQELVESLDRFPKSFWTQFERTVVLQNHNVFQLFRDEADSGDT
jgi:probable selenium-dependent hydroxylase accessory protein YqeC